ncbi:MAG: hypothetical protein M0D57_17410 [Sphingobacteriales bacterium JAD_PAG50586_3]|nr:MAG: hypothetical protein M0D57_17410 [Sphingobacteriales bacterium JAD_PAG50586_3]
MKKCFFLFLLLVPALLNAQDRGDRAYITKPGSMYTTYKFGPDEESDITSVVGGDEFSRIDATCRESSWPDGISNLTAFFDNEEDIKRYTTYFVCRFGDNKVLLRVPEGENRSMPSHMRPSETIYFIIGGDAVSYSGGSSSGTTSYTRSAKQVTVTNFGDLYSTYTFSSTDEADIKDAVGSSVFQDIETYANERNWPSAISGFDDRQTNRPKMYNYYVELVCEFGDRVVLRAPVSKNSHMSGGMRLTHDIYFIIGKAGVDLSGGGVLLHLLVGFTKAGLLP